jgi:hypothetical protein
MSDPMVASKRHLIPISEQETVELIQYGIVVSAAFGTGGMALIWEEGKPVPESVRMLALMRGISNENMDGTGI